MYCYFCGKENKDDQKFCTYCGKSLYPGNDNHEKTQTPDDIIKDENERICEEGYPEKTDQREKEAGSKNRDERVKESEAEKASHERSKSGTKGLLITVIVLLSLLLVGVGFLAAIYFTGRSKQSEIAETIKEVNEEEPVSEGVSEEKAEEKAEKAAEEKHGKEDIEIKEDSEKNKGNGEESYAEDKSSHELLGGFLSDKTEAIVFGDKSTYSGMNTEFGIDKYEYRDVDNDGEEELLIYSEINFYPLLVLDAHDGVVEELCMGEGTAGYLNFYDFDGSTWACFQDTSHAGRQIYNFVKYKGRDIVDEFILSAEYWDNDNDRYDKDSVFTYRDSNISMEEYERLLEKYTGIEPDHSIPESFEITIDSKKTEDYTDLNYQRYHSVLGSKRFNFIYPVNLYENVSHSENTGITDVYGTLTENVIFTGGAGSTLEYRMYRRNEQYSKEDMLNAVYLGEAANLTILPGGDPNIIAPKVEKGYGLTVISGWNLTATGIVYEVIEIEDDYILMMKAVTPDNEAAKAMTTQLYEECGFNRENLWGK